MDRVQPSNPNGQRARSNKCSDDGASSPQLRHSRHSHNELRRGPIHLQCTLPVDINPRRNLRARNLTSSRPSVRSRMLFRGTSPLQTAHSLDALISFVVFVLAPLFFRRSSKIVPSWTRVSVWSLRVGIVSLALLVAYLATTVLSLSPYLGFLQRLFLGVLSAWMIMTAYNMARLSPLSFGHLSR
jgi:hypothetical protein